MLFATVIGQATATVKHPTLTGRRLVIVQPMQADGSGEGEPLIAVDPLSGRKGDRVMITSDGASIREMIGSDNTPVRWAVIGVMDDS